MIPASIKPAKYVDGRMVFDAPEEKKPSGEDTHAQKGDAASPDDEKKEKEAPHVDMVPAVSLPLSRSLRAGTPDQAAQSPIATGKAMGPQDQKILDSTSIEERVALAEARAKAKAQAKPDPKDALLKETAVKPPPDKQGGPAPRSTLAELAAKKGQTGAGVSSAPDAAEESVSETAKPKKEDGNKPVFFTFERKPR